MVLSEAQEEVREPCAFLRHQTTGNLRSALPCAEDKEFSVGEGMRSTESRMRENRTYGLMSRGLETTCGSLTEGQSESDGIATGP